MVATIDGPAGVGKSTIARCVADSCGFLYLNSGSFYRAITWAVLRSRQNPEDSAAILAVASECNLDMRDGALSLDGRIVEQEIHTDEVDRWVARHSSIPEVRDVVNRELRRLSQGRDVVADGRDMGTVVFPLAEIKVFLDATVETRAERRFKQGTSRLSLEEISRAIAERDRVDRSKAVGRLDVAPGALYIETSHLTIPQVCDRVAQAILVRKNHLGDTRRV